MSMSEAFDDDDFRDLIKDILSEARENAKDRVLREYGDEFGDVNLGDFNDFKNVFMDPFTDVIKTTIGSMSKLSTKARTVLTTLLKGIPSLIIPGVSTKYKNIFAKEDVRMDRIRQKYGDVFDRTGNIFEGEMGLVSFMLNPTLMIAAKAASSAPVSILNLVDALSGHSPEITDKTGEIRRMIGVKESTLARLVLLEDEQKNREAVRKLMNDKAFQDALKNSDRVKEMQRDAQNIINNTLLTFKHDAEKMERAVTLDDVASVIGKRIDIEAEIKDVPDEEKDQVRNVILGQIKNAYFDALNEGLELAAKEFETANIPEAADIRRVYQKVIDAINGMKK